LPAHVALIDPDGSSWPSTSPGDVSPQPTCCKARTREDVPAQLECPHDDDH
jgi:hypothetical protein